MRAEIFLATFLGGLLAIFVYKVFVRTVIWPLSGYLIKRMFKGRPLPGQEGTQFGTVTQYPLGEFVSTGSDYLPSPTDAKRVEAWQRTFHAQQDVLVAALDVQDGEDPEDPECNRMILAAARVFRDAIPERQRTQMRAMAAFRHVVKQANSRASTSDAGSV